MTSLRQCNLGTRSQKCKKFFLFTSLPNLTDSPVKILQSSQCCQKSRFANNLAEGCVLATRSLVLAPRFEQGRPSQD